MLLIFQLLGTFVGDLIKSQRRLEIENLFLRHQLNIAVRRTPHRLRLRGSDRALLVWMTWLWPSLLGISRVVQPDTILRWHRAGFRAYWRWKSHGRRGRPKISRELRELIRRMSKENPLWGAPRIHGELLKLGFEIAESTVSKYMIRRRGPPNHVLGDGRLGDFEPKLQQFTMNTRRAPKWILLAHPPNEFAQLTANFWPASATVRFPAPIGPKPRAMPPQERVRLNHAGYTEKAWPEPSHPYQQRPVTPTQPQTVRCTPHGNIELMPKKEILDFKPAL